MSIQSEQNSPPYIELQRAAGFLYSRAKFFGSIRVVIAVTAIVIAPFILILAPHTDLLVGIAGAILILISELWLEPIEDDFKEQGAKAQEQFDTGIFSLPWNEIRVGEPVSHEVIVASAIASKSPHPVTNWYPDTTGVPQPLDILICQRASLVWDMRLREHFASAITLILIVWLLLMLVFGVNMHQDLGQYLLAMLLPAAPAVSQTIKARHGHLRTAANKRELLNWIARLWRRGLANLSSVSTEDCRQIQDRIFELREQGPMVPNRWYSRLRNRYEEDMQIAGRKLKQEFLNSIDPQHQKG